MAKNNDAADADADNNSDNSGIDDNIC